MTEEQSFHELLAADPAVRSRLSDAQIAALLDPGRYTGMCRHFAEQGAIQARDTAAAISRRTVADRP